MEVSEIFDRASGFVALAAILGFLLLIPLYLSQRRDVVRLRDWMEREPEYPPADIEANERILDRAEAELEELLGIPGAAEAEPITGETQATAATRVTSERPALERITMERAALEPHPRWRRFAARVNEPRVLVAIAIAALVLGGAGIFVSEKILEDGDDERATPALSEIDPADVRVSVLNGTAIGGLAGNVGKDIESFGYGLEEVTTTAPGYVKSVVQYAEGQKPAARKLANDLGIKKVEPLDRELRRLAGAADVVVIAGEDRAR